LGSQKLAVPPAIIASLAGPFNIGHTQNKLIFLKSLGLGHSLG